MMHHGDTLHVGRQTITQFPGALCRNLARRRRENKTQAIGTCFHGGFYLLAGATAANLHEYTH
jgi:hypothetical protein